MTPYADLEQQLAADLRALAPADTDLLIAGCFEDGAGDFGYRALAVGGLLAGQPVVTDFAEKLPVAVREQFTGLRRTMADDPGIRSLWEVGKAVMLCQPDEDGQPVPAQFYYGFPERAGHPDNDEAYNLPTAEELESRLAGSVPDEQDEPAPAPSRAAAAPAARPTPTAPATTTWVCTWCKEKYTGTKQPTSFQPGKCPRNPGKAHAWHT